jgi:membrane-bound lytic murein transglycosylase F
MNTLAFHSARGIFAIVIGLSLMLIACTDAPKNTSLGRVLDANVLKVGTVYGRTSYFNGADGPLGFEYELALGFANYLGVDLQIYPYYSNKDLLPQLQSNNVDIVATGQTITDTLSKQYKIGPVYQQLNQQLVYRQGNTRPRSFADIHDTLAVVADSSHAHTLEVSQHTYPSLAWFPSNDADAEELLVQVAKGELNYTLADSNVLAMLRRRYPELSVGFTVRKLQGVSWLLNAQTDDSLLGAMLDYFGEIQANGTFKILEEKYFGHIRNFDYVDTRAYIAAVNQVLPKYRPLFIKYASHIDWRLLAAMSYQESHWQPKATSPTGVRGIMMLTQATAQDMKITSRLDPEQSIMGGARYFASLLSRIPARIKEPDRIWMALAAYNIGLGHLEDARVLTQRQGGSPDLWFDVKKRLPMLEQKKYYRTTRYGYARGDEALHYVENIRRYYDTLVWLSDNLIDETHPEVINENVKEDILPTGEEVPAIPAL